MTAKQKVYEELRELIIEGKLKENEQILVEDLADKYSVSRTPVREALQLLETQKLVTMKKGKGTVVTKMDIENLTQLYWPMMTLQELAVKMACETVRPDQIQYLWELNQAFNEQAKKRQNTKAILDLDYKFHNAIIEISGNEYVMDFCEVLWGHIQRLEYSFFSKSGTLDVSYDEHITLIQAMQRKDSFSATMRMRDHWNRTVLEIQNSK